MNSLYSMNWFKKEKRVEPHKRNKDGVQWIVHRFPIKGGITMKDAMIYDMMNQRNHFLDLIKTH